MGYIYTFVQVTFLVPRPNLPEAITTGSSCYAHNGSKSGEGVATFIFLWLFLKLCSKGQKLHHLPLLQHGDCLAGKNVCPRARNLGRDRGRKSIRSTPCNVRTIATRLVGTVYLLNPAIDQGEHLIYSLELNISSAAGPSQQIH